MESMIIRPATDSDCERIAEINVFAWRGAYRGIVADQFLFGTLTVANRLQGIRKAMAHDAERFFVVERDGIVSGFTRFGLSRDRTMPEARELYAIYVDPGFQRLGFGRRLMEHFLEFDVQEHQTEAMLWVFKENHESRQFYEKIGFRPDGEEQMYADLAPAVRYIWRKGG